MTRMAGSPGNSLSIIVPVLNESAGILDALQALVPMRSRGVEVIVVDGGSDDGTADLVRASGMADAVIQTTRGRAVQMNAGAGVAHGDVLLFLHADTRLPPGADALVLQAMEGTEPARGWGRFDVTIEGAHPMLGVIAWSMNRRSRLTGIATGDQAMFMRRDAFDSVGGFPPIALMEDIAMSARLKRLSSPVCLAERVRTSGRRWESRGVLRTMLGMWWMRLRYFFGAEPAQLAANYADIRHAPQVAAQIDRHDEGRVQVRKDRTVLVFAKAPVPGEVKTRLIPALGANGAAALHRRLTRVAIEAACEAAPGSVELWCAPDVTHPFFAELASEYGVGLRVQSGGDLGERMDRALAEALLHSERVVLIGSDIAVMTAAMLGQAFDRLNDDADVVLGPAEDGGYVLIGLRRAQPALFRDMVWSHPQVLNETRRRATEARLRWSELPLLWDVDTVPDLERLRRLRPDLMQGLTMPKQSGGASGEEQRG
jgi:rSAM/selenodomain-associated transferase 2/rSAM/selenodomain-associated transferase 1